MPDLVMFPDMDVVAHAYLRQGLEAEGVAVPDIATQIPAALPDWFIQCFALPGRQTTPRTQWCQVIVKVAGPNDVDASQLARVCAAVMRSAPDMVVDLRGEKLQLVSEPCELHGPFPTLDPDLPNRQMYQVNVTWTVQSQV